MKNNLIVFVLLILLSIFVLPANATITNITASGDADLREDFPSTNYGTATTMTLGCYLGNCASNERAFTIKFDLSSIPSGSTINSVKLYIYKSSGSGGSSFVAGVGRRDSSFDESTVTWSTQGTSTFDFNFTFYNTEPAGNWYNFTVTNTVRGWYNGSFTNGGWLFNPTYWGYSPEASHTFSTREAASNKPYISVDYTPPPPNVPPAPVNCQASTGNFWVNTSCQAGSGNVTDGMNKSVNGAWYNTTAFFYNSTLSAHAWQNVSYYAWNNTGALNNTLATLNTQIPNNAIAISNISDSYTLNEEQTLYIDANYADADSDTGTFARNFTKGSFNTGTGVLSWTTANGDRGTYNWQINVSDGYGSVSTKTFTVTVNATLYIPPAPVNCQASTGNFWINTSCQAGSGNVTDAMNKSVNGAWYNTTAFFYNSSLSAHAWQNVSFYAWNNSVVLNNTPATLNTQIPNNQPSTVNITLSPANPSVTDNLTISMNGTDTDGDSLTKYYRWYKNGVLNNSWNDTTILYASGNYTSGDQIYVRGFLFDGYENGSELQSNTVIIGSNNTAPILSGIVLSSNTRKFNKSIYVNSSTSITDTESTLVRLRVFWYNNSVKTFLGNSSWVSSNNNASASITIPWSNGTNYIIYGEAEDNGNGTQNPTTNLTSSEKSASFTLDRNPPNFINNSLSAGSITVGNTVTIYLNVNCTQTAGFNDCDINNVKVKILRPDASYGVGDDGNGNWTMTHDSGTLWYKSYTSTADIGTYSVSRYYATDDSGVTGTDTSSLTFIVSAAQQSTGSTGGGNTPETSVETISKVDWKILPNTKIDMPVFVIGEGNALWSYFLSSNLEIVESQSKQITSKILNKTTIALSYDLSQIDGSTNIYEKFNVKNKNGEYKEIEVKLTIISFLGSFKIYPIYVGFDIANSDYTRIFFVTNDSYLVGIRYLTLTLMAVFFSILIGGYYVVEVKKYNFVKAISTSKL